MEDFKDKTAFITGGAAGIGLAMAREFLKAGAEVVIADIRQEALDKAVGSLGASAKLRAIRLDVTDRKSVDEVVNAVNSRFGKIDILVNNAGINAFGGVADDALAAHYNPAGLGFL